MLVLKKIETPHIKSNLFYTTTHNAFYKDMYTSFGLKEALVHPELYEKLIQLEPILEKHNLNLIIYDAFRPLEVQKFMYETAPAYLKPYIAPPPQEDSKRGFHPRGVAIDCYLTDLEGNELEFPTKPDAFYVGYEKDKNYPSYLKKCHRDYFGSDVSQKAIAHRKLLEDMMVEIGLEPLPHEWWHFNLKEAWTYPLIPSLKNVKIE
ncbi:MAG: hypothetical protein IJY92_00205 [Alphaproteobacteria bacterium]|nr:hypothetical protein [Alphaproteobacteria bacterium]